MNSIRELLAIIKERPVMYLGGHSISNLKAFIDGWRFRCPENITDLEILAEFQDWVEEKYKLKRSHSWAKILLFFSNDESDALQLFFREFDLFLSEKTS